MANETRDINKLDQNGGRSNADAGSQYAGRTSDRQGGKSDAEANTQQGDQGSSGSSKDREQTPGAQKRSEPVERRNGQDERTNIGVDDRTNNK